MLVGVLRDSPELRDVLIDRVPSALAPAIPVLSDEEKPSIHAILVGDAPCHESILIAAAVIRVSKVRQIGVVDVALLGEVAFLLVQEEQCEDLEAIVVKHIEVSVHSGESLPGSSLNIGIGNQLTSHHVISLGVSWHPLHDI